VAGNVAGRAAERVKDDVAWIAGNATDHEPRHLPAANEPLREQESVMTTSTKKAIHDEENGIAEMLHDAGERLTDFKDESVKTSASASTPWVAR